MFNLDFRLFNAIYEHCYRLGSSFGYGAFEGLVLYASVISLAVITVASNKKVEK